jgi:flagellar basal-body rod modification protein FlgD
MSTGISSIANASVRSSAASAVSGTQSTSEKDRKTIASNFDQFLSLLTTQLKNQSPLDPLDSNQFTQQLVQFSSVEQQLKTNDLLSNMAKSFGGGGSGTAGKLNAASAASLIGVQVSADGSTSALSKVPGNAGAYRASYPVKVQENYTNYQVTIADEKGDVVYAGKWSPPGTGDQTYVWDGLRTNGTQADTAQKYNIQVTGELSSNSAMKSVMSTERAGVVSAVDLSGSEEVITFGGFSTPISKIKRVSAAGT